MTDTSYTDQDPTHVRARIAEAEARAAYWGDRRMAAWRMEAGAPYREYTMIGHENALAHVRVLYRALSALQERSRDTGPARLVPSDGLIVSTDTLRSEDLIFAFTATLEYYAPRAASTIRETYADVYRIIDSHHAARCFLEACSEYWVRAHQHYYQHETLYVPPSGTRDARILSRLDSFDYCQEALFDALDAIAPDGCTFGASEGDGACFGFFPYPDADLDGPDDTDPDPDTDPDTDPDPDLDGCQCGGSYSGEVCGDCGHSRACRATNDATDPDPDTCPQCAHNVRSMNAWYSQADTAYGAHLAHTDPDAYAAWRLSDLTASQYERMDAMRVRYAVDKDVFSTSQMERLDACRAAITSGYYSERCDAPDTDTLRQVTAFLTGATLAPVPVSTHHTTRKDATR